MNLGNIAAYAEICVGLGATVWALLLAWSCLQEHRRSVTAEVEILGSLKLPEGPAYRFSPTEGRIESPGSELDWVARTPQKFRSRQFTEGEIVAIDYDPGYGPSFYPAGKYPRFRLWPIFLVAVAIGAMTVAFGTINLS
ncbi:hypothetical protein OG349_23655 [Streptomyces sp. NBC_01317]|uniref:hypothetical protein n=1 Tax=Streptomyces sp. NBC_01317 TaxID=2903822 RepID=UPI002E1360EA|nr:hypothetical protein OG349_23655 [Streptomyces sp. NBC_01317]